MSRRGLRFPLSLISCVQAQLRWGAECQPYEMSMTAAFAHTPDAKPALMTKLHWAAVPETWAAMGKR